METMSLLPAFVPAAPVVVGGALCRGRFVMKMPGGSGRRFRFDFGKGGSSFNGFGGFFGGMRYGGLSGSGFGGGSFSGKSAGSTGGPGDSGNFFVALWHAYNNSLESSPIMTKALTSLVGFFLGDLLAQKFLTNDGSKSLDKGRLARMASFGFLFHGPSGHYFYNFLDRFIPGKSPVNIVSKIAVDQLLWAPVFTACFFVYLGVTERKSRQQITDKVKNDTWTGVTASWKFWPLAHAINFALVPTQQRLLYINTLQVGYNVILSLIGNK